VSIVGDGIHKNRSLLQLVVNGTLPSEKIVCTNQDLENLIGRQLTFASQMVNGIRCGSTLPPLHNTAIWTADQGLQAPPERTVSLALASALLRLEVAGESVRMITPAARRQRPTGWQDVSEAYRNFAVGQLIEAEQAVAQCSSRSLRIATPRESNSKKLRRLDACCGSVERRVRGHRCVQGIRLALRANDRRPDPKRIAREYGLQIGRQDQPGSC
jgi:hypothetical protein